MKSAPSRISPPARRIQRPSARATWVWSPCFSAEHKAPAVLVVAQHRARPVPARPLARAVGAQRAFAHRVGKGQAAQCAPRRREEGDAAPASAAQRIRLVDDLAAGQAARRQHAVDDGSPDPAQRVGSPAGKGCRSLHSHTSSGRGLAVNRTAGLNEAMLAAGRRVDPVTCSTAEPGACTATAPRAKATSIFCMPRSPTG